MLQSTIKAKHFDSTFLANLQPFLADCNDAVQNLARELDKVKKESPSAASSQQSLKGKLANASKALLYLLRKSLLKKLHDFIREVRENLSMATCLVHL
jgi:hypothetical protein